MKQKETQKYDIKQIHELTMVNYSNGCTIQRLFHIFEKVECILFKNIYSFQEILMSGSQAARKQERERDTEKARLNEIR